MSPSCSLDQSAAWFFCDGFDNCSLVAPSAASTSASNTTDKQIVDKLVQFPDEASEQAAWAMRTAELNDSADISANHAVRALGKTVLGEATSPHPELLAENARGPSARNL